MVRLIKRGAQVLLRTNAFARIVSRLESLADARPNLLRVLTYHRVDHPGFCPHLYPGTLSATPDEFRWQIACLAERYEFVDVQAVLAAVRGQRELPPRSLLITFDDAYADFVVHAWPTLRRHGVPALLFVPTGFPGNRCQAFWWDRLQRAAQQSGALATAAGRRRLRETMQHAKSLPHHETLALVDEYCRDCNAAPAASDVLDWEQLRQLAGAGLDLAAHTRTHPLLTRISAEEAVREAVLSRQDLREVVGADLPVFAYPGGACNEELAQALAAAGFEVAFTTRRGLNDLATANPLLLRRINVSVKTSRAAVRAQLLAGMRYWDPFGKNGAVAWPRRQRACRTRGLTPPARLA